MGVKTLYEYFYKLAYGDKGADKATLVNDCFDVADAEIKANKGHTIRTDNPHSVTPAQVGADTDDISEGTTNKYQGSNIVKCADYAHPDDAITAIGASNITLVVTEAETCDTNFTVPANVTVRFERGGKWTINTGITVTFNGQIEAGLWQIFEYVGTGTLAGTPKIREVYPQWWGALGNGTNDDTTAIQNAIDIMETAGGGIVFLPTGRYKVTSTINLNNATNPITLQGAGARRGSLTLFPFTIIDYYGDTAAINITEGYYILKDIQIRGTNSTDTKGILVHSLYNKFYNINVYNFDSTGIEVGSAGSLKFYNEFYGCTVTACSAGVHLVGNENKFYGGNFSYNETNFLMTAGNNNLLSGVSMEGHATATDYGLKMDTVDGDIYYNTVIGCRFELPKAGATGVLLDKTGAYIINYNTFLGNYYSATTKFDDSSETTKNIILETMIAPLISLPYITFPATQVPSANANTLDDYKEEAWTPALKFGGASVGMTYTIQAGLYTKIGRQVTITGYISLSAKGTSTGNATITGLPFSAKNADGANAQVTLWLQSVTFANVPQAYISKNTAYINLDEVTEAGAATHLTDADFADNSFIQLSATYFTD